MEINDHLSYAPISVVIPCYNAEPYLGRAVNSVLSQSLLPLELILIDDASTDGGITKTLIENLINRIPKIRPGIKAIPVFLGKNHGPGNARNAGWEKATQPWIAFLDADDVWDHQKLEIQYQCLQLNPSIDLLAHKSQFLNNNKFLEKKRVEVNCIQVQKINLRQMLLSNLFPTRSVMLRNKIKLRFPSRRESEDYSLWLEIIASGSDVRLMNCVLAYTFKSEYSKGGYSGNLWEQEKRELQTIINFFKKNKLNSLILLICINWSLIKYFRRLLIKLIK